MAEERKVKSKPSIFRHDQLVIVYDDLSPAANDLCVLGANINANDDDRKWFTSLTDDFARMINVIGRYHYEDTSNQQCDVDLLPVPLSRWLDMNRDQRPDDFNTPLLVAFVQFFYWRQADAHDLSIYSAIMLSSRSVTKIILQQLERVYTANVHNIRPHDYESRYDYAHISAVCLSRWGLSSVNSSGIWPRYNALERKLANDLPPGEARYEFPLSFETTHVHLSTKRALEDTAYRNKIVGNYLLRRIVRYTMFKPLAMAPRVWNTEAAALSSIVSHGLCARGTPVSQFLTRGLYDPRLFLHIWNAITGETLPNLDRTDKRKKEGDDDDDDED